MAYSDFTISQLKKQFGLTIDEDHSLFDHVAEVDLPITLADTLRRYLPLALNLNTEKARSELIIAPFLADFKLLYHQHVSLFSGLEFNINEAAGLKGRCDYILAGSPEQLSLNAPVCILVEATQAREVLHWGQDAKNENIIAGIPQCLAEMLAALKFNSDNGVTTTTMYGVVTTAMQWRFLKLSGTNAQVDNREYSIQSATKIFAILKYMIFGDTN
jgi:hypothetical protein